jgi:hypothetical protein
MNTNAYPQPIEMLTGYLGGAKMRRRFQRVGGMLQETDRSAAFSVKHNPFTRTKHRKAVIQQAAKLPLQFELFAISLFGIVSYIEKQYSRRC